MSMKIHVFMNMGGARLAEVLEKTVAHRTAMASGDEIEILEVFK